MYKTEDNKIILASTSKSRKNILKLAGIKYKALNSGVDEEKTKKSYKGKPKDLALILAKENEVEHLINKFLPLNPDTFKCLTLKPESR